MSTSSANKSNMSKANRIKLNFILCFIGHLKNKMNSTMIINTLIIYFVDKVRKMQIAK